MYILTLRDYQNEAVDYILERLQHPSRLGQVVVPTAGGKTAIFKCALKLALDRDLLQGVIIVTPRAHIEEHFSEKVDFKYEDPDGNIHLVSITDKTFIRPRKKRSTNDKVFQSYMNNPAGHILVTTHSQFVQWQHLIPKDTTGFLLAVDEGHRKGNESTLLFDLAEQWWEAGGFLLDGTATPFRTDDRTLLPASVDVVFTVPYTRLMIWWGFPAIEFRLHSLNPGTTRLPDGFTLMDAKKIIKYVMDSGRDTLIHIPRGSRKNGAKKLAELLIQEAGAAGYPRPTLLDTTGDEDKIAKDVTDRLSSERQILRVKGYNARTLRMVVSCERILEGADWAACSQVLTIGQSTSAGREAQKVGRGLRPKDGIEGFPEEFGSDTIYAVFIEELDPTDLSGRQRQAASSLLMACFLEGSDAALDYARYFERLVSEFRLPPVVRQTLTTTMLDPNVAAAKVEVLTEVVNLQSMLGRFPKLSELMEAIRNNTSLTPQDKLCTVRELLISSSAVNPAIREGLRKILREQVAHLQATQGNSNPSHSHRDLFWEALCDLAQKHESHLVDIHTHPVVGASLYSKLGATTMKNVVQEMINKRNIITNLPDAEIIRIMNEYRSRYGVFPVEGRGVQDVSEIVNYHLSVGDLERRLVRTGINLPTLRIALPWFRQSPVPMAQYQQRAAGKHIPIIQLTSYLNPADLWKAQNDWKFNQAAQILGAPGENWVGLAFAAWRGWRGIPAGTDILSLLR